MSKSQRTILRCTADQLGGDPIDRQIGQGGFGTFSRGFGLSNFLMLDERTLSRVADITDGAYYAAESADELLEVFAEIPVQLEEKKERTEVSGIFTALGALLALGAIGLGLRWSPLP